MSRLLLEIQPHEVPWSWKALAMAVLLFVCNQVLEESAAAHRDLTEAADPSRVDINFGTEKDLDGLPGVGPSLARAIMAARPYSSPEELDRVKGISPKTVERLRSLIKVGQGRRAADQR